MMYVLSIFQYDFMIRAFAAGICIAVVAPVIGMFLVTRRYSFLADTLAHVSLAGVAVGYIAGFQPILSAMVASILTALSVEHLRTTRRIFGESALALFLSGGLSLAAVLLSLSSGMNINLSSLLFGSIATVNSSDVSLIALLSITVIAAVLFLYRELLAVSFDEQLAAASGIQTKWINRIFVVTAAVTVSMSLRIVGILLIGALMVIPVIAAQQFERGFRTTMILAVGISLLSVLAGLFVSYFAGVSSGGTIVLIAIVCFILSLLFRRLADVSFSSSPRV